jgi:hypothetical protein
MNKTITIIVSPDGKTKIETDGYTGSSCREASRFLEDALGIGTVKRLKDEYFLEENRNLQNKEQCQC